ncbi:hypothetical protein E1A91_A13G242300v1 [Gossypium mustelinum]|uniref:Uncharacterized protein n=1 Tax=Gossypium mustelinum TaxID=34275 RepID=A0A5D2WMI1_GOSMU|nr:hypothetical protein E1A91_A13G242300v1 [Gossypium mustelinum]
MNNNLLDQIRLNFLCSGTFLLYSNMHTRGQRSCRWPFWCRTDRRADPRQCARRGGTWRLRRLGH